MVIRGRAEIVYDTYRDLSPQAQILTYFPTDF
jgi:hypothetical protein